MNLATLSRLAALVFLATASLALASEPAFQYMSPRPGAKFVSRATTLAFRPGEGAGSPGTFPAIDVVGDASGRHGGEWTLADDGKTLIFQPSQEFAPGETVSVTVGFARAQESYSFTVSSRTGSDRPVVSEDACLDQERSWAAPGEGTRSPRPAKAAGTPAPFGFPEFEVTVNTTPDTGQVFIAPATWLAILDSDGTFSFFANRHVRATDFKKSPSGNLTFMERDPLTPIPAVRAKGVVMDDTYTVIDEYVAGNGYAATTDFHEFTQLPNGDVILMAYDDETVDMSQIVSGGNPDATVQGLILQELDPSHNVVFEWRSWDHFQITDTYQSLTTGVIDYVHGNAVEVDTDGNWLLSSRNLSEITKIDRSTGDIIWRLGGKNNEFQMADSFFTRQHDVRRLANGNITVHDNGNDSDPQETRALELALHETSPRTAEVVWQFYHPDHLFAAFTGSVRRLPNGNTFISWGNQQRQTEVAPDGTIVWESVGLGTYRAVRLTWGRPVAAVPTLWVEPIEGSSSALLHFTKFGDDSVAQYCIYRGRSPGTVGLVDATTDTSYLVSGLATGVGYYFRVTSKDAQGVESPFSNAELVYLDPVVPVFVGRFDATRGASGIDLAWELTTDHGVSGFDLYRSENDGPSRALNPAGLLAPTQRTFHDATAAFDRLCAYTLVIVLSDGSTVESHAAPVQPSRMRLSLDQNHPNPFNPATVISFTVPEASFVDLGVFDLVGRRIRTLQRGPAAAGQVSVVWDGRDDAHQRVASGVYLCRLAAGKQTLTRKMLLVE